MRSRFLVIAMGACLICILLGGCAATLQDCVLEHDFECTRHLLEKGAELNRSGKWGKTPLHWAATENDVRIARLLIQRGADVNARDDWHWTPLHSAALVGNPDMVRLLLDAGAEVNAQSDHDWTPLHAAAFNGHYNITGLLVERGADTTLEYDRGWSPMEGHGHARETRLTTKSSTRGGQVRTLDDGTGVVPPGRTGIMAQAGGKEVPALSTTGIVMTLLGMTLAMAIARRSRITG
ncbi:ankyrin repeat domain-containing protein [bacterium]|nr:ankyrin repeat domain-containing protein [candidate division CSSED10-310 bacterium]